MYYRIIFGYLFFSTYTTNLSKKLLVLREKKLCEVVKKCIFKILSLVAIFIMVDSV